MRLVIGNLFQKMCCKDAHYSKLFITTSSFQTACVSSIANDFSYKRIIIVRLNASRIPNLFNHLPDINPSTAVEIIDLDLEKHKFSTFFSLELLIFLSSIVIDEVFIASLNNPYVSFVADGFRRKCRLGLYDDGTMSLFFNSVLAQQQAKLDNWMFATYLLLMGRKINLQTDDLLGADIYSFFPYEVWDIKGQFKENFYEYDLVFKPFINFCPINKRIKLLLGIHIDSGADFFDESDLLTYHLLVERLNTHLLVPHPKASPNNNSLCVPPGVLIEQLVSMMLQQGFFVEIVGQQSTVFWSLKPHKNLRKFIILTGGLRRIANLSELLLRYDVNQTTASEYLHAKR